MRRHVSQEKYDELYDNMSDDISNIVYSDILPNTLLGLRNEHDVSIDILGDIQTLVVDTLLGLCPTADFKAELLTLGLPREKVGEVIEYLDDNIFSALRESQVDEYSYEEGEIPATQYRETAQDSYREAIPLIKTSAPTIQNEHLEAGKEHILDEMYSDFSPKIKELTKEDGSVVNPLDETPHHSDMFEEEKAENKEEKKEEESLISNLTHRFFTKKESVDVTEELKEHLDTVEKPEIEIKIEDTTRKPVITLQISKDTNSSQSVSPQKISIEVKPKNVTSQEAGGSESYKIDPYREVL